jgi:energy-converting hydrogenase Eha subunit G
LHSQNHQQLRTGADPAWITIAENQTFATFVGCYLSPLSCHPKEIPQGLINLNRLVKSIKTGHISSTGKKFYLAGRRIDGAWIYEPCIIN